MEINGNIYRDCNRKARKFLVRSGINRSDYRDILHDSWLILYEKISKLNFESSMSICTYFIEIVKRRILNWKKKNRPSLLSETEEKELTSNTTIHEENFILAVIELHEFIWKCIDKLDDKCRKDFYLRYKEGLSDDEIVEILEIKNKNSLHATRSKCKKKVIGIIRNDPDSDEYVGDKL